MRAQLSYALESLWHIREPAARARLRGQLDSLRALPHFLRKRAHRFSTTAAPQLATPDESVDSLIEHKPAAAGGGE